MLTGIHELTSSTSFDPPKLLLLKILDLCCKYIRNYYKTNITFEIILDDYY